jgi:hypothetical protein
MGISISEALSHKPSCRNALANVVLVLDTNFIISTAKVVTSIGTLLNRFCGSNF